jgi:hypothetical protein
MKGRSQMSRMQPARMGRQEALISRRCMPGAALSATCLRNIDTLGTDGDGRIEAGSTTTIAVLVTTGQATFGRCGRMRRAPGSCSGGRRYLTGGGCRAYRYHLGFSAGLQPATDPGRKYYYRIVALPLMVGVLSVVPAVVAG